MLTIEMLKPRDGICATCRGDGIVIPRLEEITPPTMLQMAPFGAGFKGNCSTLNTTLTWPLSIATRFTKVRMISRFVVRSALSSHSKDSRPLVWFDEKPKDSGLLVWFDEK